MKRHMDDEGSQSNGKRARERSNDAERDGGEIEIRLLIPSGDAGAIIGRGGDVIKRLRTEYDATVNVPDSNSPERVLLLAGQESTVLRLLGECVEKMQLNKGSERDRRHSRKSDSSECDVRVLVHQSQAGAIIGKGGSEVKRLREETQAGIRVFSTCCPESQERIIQVTGDLERTLEAVRRVVEVCCDTDVKGANRPYDPAMSYGGVSYAEYGGFPGERGSGGGGGGYRGGGPPPAWGGGGGRGGGRRSPPPRHFDDRRGGGGSRGGGMSNSGFMQGPLTTTQVTVPDNLMGIIIGRRGETINRVRDRCGAVIKVEDLRPGDTDRIITISGDDNQIQMAQFLMQQVVRERESGGGGDGGSGGHRRSGGGRRY